MKKIKCSKKLKMKLTLPKEWRTPRNLLIENIIGEISRGITTIGKVSNFCLHVAYASQPNARTCDDEYDCHTKHLAMVRT